MPSTLQRSLALAVAGLLVAGAAGCAAMKQQMKGAPDGAKEIARATADISGQGGIQGTLTLIEFENDTGTAVRVIVDVKGDPSVLTPGKHGLHFHENGTCEPTFAAAGGHFDPGPHGVSSVEKNHPWHLGDLPNLMVDARGHGTLDAVTSSVTVTPGPRTLFDANGSAVIIHAEEDQHTGQKAGGGRIACGVIRK